MPFSTQPHRVSPEAAVSVALPRVLHVYSGNLYGGIETLLVAMAQERRADSTLEQQFAVCFGGRLRDELTEAGATVHELGPVRIRWPWSVHRARRALQRLARRERIDAVICHGAWAQAVFGPAVRGVNARLVFWLHDAATGRHWLERWARRVPPDLAVCNSQFTCGTLDRLFPNVPRDVVYCPVAPPPPRSAMPSRAAIRASLGAEPNSVVIIQASRLESWKGHVLLMQALGRLRDDLDWTCWIVGGAQRPHEERYLGEVKRAAETSGVQDRVRFLGQRSDVPALLAAADIHCQPNTGPEPFGIAFVEALYAGLPVVTTDMGGAAEIVQGDCGVLVPPGDVDALAAALKELVTDAGCRTRLGNSGPSRASSLSDPAQRLAQLGALIGSLGSHDASQHHIRLRR